MKICDPLYGYIYFDKTIQSLIELPVFQRLRSIQQLGFSQYAFPSGVGNRFTHSLGCSYLAGNAFDTIFNKDSSKSLPLKDSKKQEFKKVLQIAALLHDIGHGPLSHSSECLMPELKDLETQKYFKSRPNRQVSRHEDYSIKMIMETEIFDILKKENIEPQFVAQLIHQELSRDEDFFKDNGINYLPLLKQIISSELDVDRMDYLHRDSISCGVRYGLIDFAWLLTHFDSYIKNNEVFLSIDSKALYTIESFMLGRQHMRVIVYFHHKAAIYNEMLKKYAKTSKWRLPTKINKYSHFIDSHLMDKLREDSKTNDWASRIVNQQPYVRLHEYNRIHESKEEGGNFFDRIKESLDKAGIPYIEINSNKNAIKPSKKTDSYPLFLKDAALNTTTNLFNDPNIFKIVQRQIDRIYVEPKEIERAKKFLF